MADVTKIVQKIEAECTGKAPDAVKVVRLLAEALAEPCRNADRQRAHNGAMSIAMHTPRLKAALHDRWKPDFQQQAVSAVFGLPDARTRWACGHVLHFHGVHIDVSKDWERESTAAQPHYTSPEPLKVMV